MIGGGMATFTTVFAFPAYCKACDALVLVNKFDSPLRCSKSHGVEPTPYGDASLLGGAGANVVASWSHVGQHLELTDGSYLCPGCHRLALTFRDGGLAWD